MLFVLSVAMTKTLSPFATQDIVHQCNFILCIDKWSVQLSRICTCGKVCVRVSAVLQTRQGGGGLFCICICTCGKVCVRIFTVLQTRCRGDGSLYLFCKVCVVYAVLQTRQGGWQSNKDGQIHQPSNPNLYYFLLLTKKKILQKFGYIQYIQQSAADIIKMFTKDVNCQAIARQQAILQVVYSSVCHGGYLLVSV